MPAEHYNTDDNDEGHYWSRELAVPEAVDCVLNGDRSPWYFIRLPDGDLVLATYPQEGPNGTYCHTEQWRSSSIYLALALTRLGLFHASKDHQGH